MEFNAEAFLKATGAKVVREGEKRKCSGIATDTRTLKEGALFFALKGPHFDGHRFCETAFQKGAWGVVTESPLTGSGRTNPFVAGSSSPTWVFQVSDTLKSLGDIAQWWRRQFDIPCVAITGSNGKTTTKEMAAAILATQWNTLKTEGNFNNLIGLPLMLNRLGKDHQAAVFEIGMNAAGEIRRLTEIADPTVGAVTNASAAHLEKLQTVEAVAEAKAELYETMRSKGIAVYNAEDLLLSELVRRFKGRRLSFGMRAGADVCFEHMESAGFDSMELKLSIQGKWMEAKLRTTGAHNVMNAMAACAIALGLGLSVEAMQKGLGDFSPLKMRFEQIQLTNGVRLVNDAYNANPLSMEAAFRAVGSAKRAGRFIAVLGDMKELGESAAALHRETGKKAAAHGVSRLFLIGEFAEYFAEGARDAGLLPESITIAGNEAELTRKIMEVMQAGDVVLIKGSRAMQLENVVEILKERHGL